MTELHVGDQTIRYDREATAAIYGSIQRGWFRYFSPRRDRRYLPFGDAKLGVEFTAHVKWILPEDPDSGRRPAAQPQKPNSEA